MTEFAVMPLTDYVNACDKIREKTDTTENIKSGEMPEKIDEVYEAGKKAEQVAFWERFQMGGARGAWQYAMQSSAWTDEIYHPIYPFVPTNSNSMFSQSAITDIIQPVDFSGSTTNMTNVFYYCTRLVTIPKIISTEATSFTNWFTRCGSLVEVTFEGIIAVNISFPNSEQLSISSMKNIISCLKNHAGTANEFVHKITFPESRWEALEAESTSPSGGTWKEYVQNSLGWNV